MRKLSQVSSGLSAERPKPDSNARFSCSITAGIEVLKLLHDTVFTFPTFALDPPATLPFMLSHLTIHCVSPPALLATLLTHVKDDSSLVITDGSVYSKYANEDPHFSGARDLSALRHFLVYSVDTAVNAFLLPFILTMKSLKELSISPVHLILVEQVPSSLNLLSISALGASSEADAANFLDLLQRRDGSLSQLEPLVLDGPLSLDLSAIKRICAERGIKLEVSSSVCSFPGHVCIVELTSV